MIDNRTDNIECTPEETATRLATCIPCKNFAIQEDKTTKCSACDCSIGFMTTLNFKSCPEGNW
jgi:hypothetical protein